VNEPSKDADPAKEELTYFIQKLLERITINLGRVQALITLADHYPDPPEELAIHTQDILRAAVVFLHATLEDFLRYIGETYLPATGEEVLNRVPLLGTQDVLRPEKFFLGKLAQHRGKTVDQLITESVNAYLDRVSFSDTTDISNLLEGAGIPVQEVRPLYLRLSALMTRRHQIVHRADLVDVPADHLRKARPIDAATVTEWAGAVKKFCACVSASKVQQDFVPKLKRKHTPETPNQANEDRSLPEKEPEKTDHANET
jgi:hypothetical protein